MRPGPVGQLIHDYQIHSDNVCGGSDATQTYTNSQNDLGAAVFDDDESNFNPEVFNTFEEFLEF